MIVAVGGIPSLLQEKYEQAAYKREFYQPQTGIELKQDIEKDFGKMLAEEISKLQIDVLI